ncbi:hypothetical protein MHYP_G00033540 [Metynnis hypsauchen]
MANQETTGIFQEGFHSGFLEYLRFWSSQERSCWKPVFGPLFCQKFSKNKREEHVFESPWRRESRPAKVHCFVK